MNDAMTLKQPARVPTLADIEQVEGRLLDFAQVDMPLTHRFAPGVYFREIRMPAGTFVIGHEHKTEHFNVILSGRADVLVDGQVVELRAPMVFVSKAGVRKMLYIREDMVWATIHPTTETNVEQLEAMLIQKSATYQRHELAKLAAHVEGGKQ